MTSREAPERGRISLADARVVIGGGRGVGSGEGFGDLEELAGLLGGAVGGSRVVTSAGWRQEHIASWRAANGSAQSGGAA